MLKFLLMAHLLAKLGQFIGGLGSPLAMTCLGFDVTAIANTIAVGATITLSLPLILRLAVQQDGP